MTKPGRIAGSSRVARAGWGLAMAVLLTAGAGFAASAPPLDITGATKVEYDARTQQYAFRGPRVVIVRGDQRLEARIVLYDAASRRVVLPEGGMVSTPTMQMTADQMTADLGARHVVAEGHVAARMLDEGVWTTLSAARVIADDGPALQQAEASGNVAAARGDQELRGDRILYDRRSRHGTADGHAQFMRGGDRLRADHVDADLATREAEATGHVLLEREGEGMRGSADRATYSERARIAVLSGHAVLTRKHDMVSAEQITMQLDRNVVVAEGHPRIVAFPQETP